MKHAQHDYLLQAQQASWPAQSNPKDITIATGALAAQRRYGTTFSCVGFSEEQLTEGHNNKSKSQGDAHILQHVMATQEMDVEFRDTLVGQ